MTDWPSILLVALMGAVGAVLRGWFSHLPSYYGLPTGTITVNLIGSFLLGLIAALSLKWDWSPEWRLAITTGFMGAFTTFSTFSLENAKYSEQGEWRTLLTNILLQTILGITLAYLGWTLAGRDG